jgi:hypothetical protein
MKKIILFGVLLLLFMFGLLRATYNIGRIDGFNDHECITAWSNGKRVDQDCLTLINSHIGTSKEE